MLVYELKSSVGCGFAQKLLRLHLGQKLVVGASFGPNSAFAAPFDQQARSE
jgi:hypothetical protein